MIIAVDTGGTKTLVARYSRQGVQESSHKFPTPAAETDYVEQTIATIHTLATSDQIDAIVIALPGIVKDGVALWCNRLGWANFDAYRVFTNAFPDTPIFIENDANLGGLGAATRTVPTASTALYVTISTGIGTGYIVDGVIDKGMRLSEGGRMLVEFQGAVKEWESFASGSAIVAQYHAYARDIHDAATWNAIADRISRGFLACIPLIQPEVVIIGGSIGTYFDQYSDRLTTLLKEHLPAHIALPSFVQAANPEEAVIHGCYVYGTQQLT